jgi:hypothetical protein
MPHGMAVNGLSLVCGQTTKLPATRPCTSTSIIIGASDFLSFTMTNHFPI